PAVSQDAARDWLSFRGAEVESPFATQPRASPCPSDWLLWNRANHPLSFPSVVCCPTGGPQCAVSSLRCGAACIFRRQYLRMSRLHFCSHLVYSWGAAKMFIPRVILSILLLLILPLSVLGQQAATNLTPGAAAETNPAPKLEHFDPNLTDQTLSPCDDFYKYACNTWLVANPIPPDQVYWSTGSSLELWNENVLRETLEASSKNDATRSPVQQKIGDYWAACMDESGIEAAGLKPLQPELAR